jgi:hypothetical protein
MALADDTAAELIALFEGIGAINELNNLGTVTSTATIDLPDPTVEAYSEAVLSTSGQVPFVLPAPAQGKRFRLLLTQDSTGSRTASFATSTGGLKWAGAAPPTLTTTAAHSDLIAFECYDGTNWVGSATLNIH